MPRFRSGLRPLRVQRSRGTPPASPPCPLLGAQSCRYAPNGTSLHRRARPYEAPYLADSTPSANYSTAHRHTMLKFHLHRRYTALFYALPPIVKSAPYTPLSLKFGGLCRLCTYAAAIWLTMCPSDPPLVVPVRHSLTVSSCATRVSYFPFGPTRGLNFVYSRTTLASSSSI